MQQELDVLTTLVDAHQASERGAKTPQ